MIEVDLGALDGGQAAQILVIGVVLKERYPLRADTLEDGLGNGRLPGPRAAGDADDEEVVRCHIFIIIAPGNWRIKHPGLNQLRLISIDGILNQTFIEKGDNL